MTKLDKLNLAKSAICGYLVLFALLLRVSHFVLLPFVFLVGSPVFLVLYCRYRKEERFFA